MMSDPIIYPKTLQEAIVYFSDPDRALRFFAEMRWPGGVSCPICGATRISFLTTRRIWKCLECKKQFSAKVGTVMEDSPLGLGKWLACIWMVVNAKNGISSYEVHRALGVKQESAWFMLHRVRYALSAQSLEKDEKFSGTVEADETYIGGLEKNRHANKRKKIGTGGVGKAVVMAILERHSGKVRAKHIPNTRKYIIQREVRENVEAGSEVFTDSCMSYDGLQAQYVHDTVNHLEEWVRGNVHTNHVENFWTLFKRCYKGTWTHLSDEHLQKYVDEQTFRFNMKEEKDGGRFIATCMQVPGKRLTYKKLTRKE